MAGPDAVDYSFSRPTTPAALRAAGIRVACRYMSPPPNGKNISSAEVAGLRAAGIGILLNWESTSGRPLGGAAYGTADGLAAAAFAESIGAPHGLTIYYSCDQSTSANQYPAIADYYRAATAATAGRYKVGAYGSVDVINYLVGQGVISGRWQTYAWSGGRLSPYADLYQYQNGQGLVGATVDFNRIINDKNLGVWWPEGLDPNGGGTPIVVPTEDEMFIITDPIAGENEGAYVTDGATTMKWIPDLTSLGILQVWLPQKSFNKAQIDTLIANVINPERASRGWTPYVLADSIWQAAADVDSSGSLTEAEVTSAVEAALANINLSLDAAALQAAITTAIKAVTSTTTVTETTAATTKFS